MRTFVTATAGLALALAAAGSAQTSADQGKPALRAAGTVDDAAGNFLQDKKLRQSEQKEKLRAAGLNFGEVRSLVARFKPKGKGGLAGLSAQKQGDLADTFLDEVALELATLGFRPGDLKDQAQAAALFSAASDKLVLAADYADYKLLSKAVVRGKVTGYRLPPKGSAGGAVMQVEVLQAYKGEIASGTAIEVVMRSGQDAAGGQLKYSDEAIPAPGAEVVLVLSQVAPSLRGGSRLRLAADPSAYTKLLEPFAVEGGVARASSPGIGDLKLSDL
ncbi:MAG: hypothetical protein QOJ91_387 [Sphingomonadales bacterium]|jgi:hypothetical protein|nr:hypothetical protein [Sphingomonadales bacterium]